MHAGGLDLAGVVGSKLLHAPLSSGPNRAAGSSRPLGHERRTQIDIVFEKVLSHVDAEIKSCPHCGAQTRAPFPEAFCGPLQYGSGIKAYALNLLIAQMISLKRV